MPDNDIPVLPMPVRSTAHPIVNVQAVWGIPAIIRGNSSEVYYMFDSTKNKYIRFSSK
jgi:hypothetical protein